VAGGNQVSHCGGRAARSSLTTQSTRSSWLRSSITTTGTRCLASRSDTRPEGTAAPALRRRQWENTVTLAPLYQQIQLPGFEGRVMPGCRGQEHAVIVVAGSGLNALGDRRDEAASQ
jgi:hypothetical protein